MADNPGYPDGKKRELTENEKSKIRELIMEFDSEDSNEPISTRVAEGKDWTRSQVAGIMANMNR